MDVWILRDLTQWCWDWGDQLLDFLSVSHTLARNRLYSLSECYLGRCNIFHRLLRGQTGPSVATWLFTWVSSTNRTDRHNCRSQSICSGYAGKGQRFGETGVVRDILYVCSNNPAEVNPIQTTEDVRHSDDRMSRGRILPTKDWCRY